MVERKLNTYITTYEQSICNFLVDGRVSRERRSELKEGILRVQLLIPIEEELERTFRDVLVVLDDLLLFGLKLTRFSQTLTQYRLSNADVLFPVNGVTRVSRTNPVFHGPEM
jgi:hypothetical protein